MAVREVPKDVLKMASGLAGHRRQLCSGMVCMLVSIVHPLCLSTLHLAINNPGMVFGRNISSLRDRRLMQVGVCLLALVNPLLLINVMESNRNKFSLL